MISTNLLGPFSKRDCGKKRKCKHGSYLINETIGDNLSIVVRKIDNQFSFRKLAQNRLLHNVVIQREDDD